MSMKPQVFTLKSEILDEFRLKMDMALDTVSRLMIEKKLMSGTVDAKIQIDMQEKTDKETGEIYYDVEITPTVNMKIGAKGKLDCQTKKALMKQNRNKETVIASNQIEMDELMQQEQGA
jgi:hypothetical protein